MHIIAQGFGHARPRLWAIAVCGLRELNLARDARYTTLGPHT